MEITWYEEKTASHRPVVDLAGKWHQGKTCERCDGHAEDPATEECHSAPCAACNWKRRDVAALRAKKKRLILAEVRKSDPKAGWLKQTWTIGPLWPKGFDPAAVVLPGSMHFYSCEDLRSGIVGAIPKERGGITDPIRRYLDSLRGVKRLSDAKIEGDWVAGWDCSCRLGRGTSGEWCQRHVMAIGDGSDAEGNEDGDVAAAVAVALNGDKTMKPKPKVKSAKTDKARSTRVTYTSDGTVKRIRAKVGDVLPDGRKVLDISHDKDGIPVLSRKPEAVKKAALRIVPPPSAIGPEAGPAKSVRKSGGRLDPERLARWRAAVAAKKAAKNAAKSA